MPDKLIRTALCLVLFISLFACSSLSSPSVPTPSPAALEKEEQAVYSYFISGIPEPALILEQTSIDIGDDDPKQTTDHIRSSMEDISRQTIDSYLTRNLQSTKLSADMDLGTEYILLSSDELARISSQPNWNVLLSEKYPGSFGYTIFSRVGFNNTLDQALIYVGSVGGPMMGSGMFYLMEKQNGEWIIKDQDLAWIS